MCGVAMLAAISACAQDDPPPEAGRISYISGTVSIQAVSSDDWGQAYPNLPVGPGDRIFTDSDGRAEIQVGQTYVRIGPNSDVTLVDDSAFNINFGIAQGSIHLHSFGLWPRQLLDISTPNGNAEFASAGDLRVDVMPTDGATVFTNLGQFADITAAGDFRQELNYGQSLELAGSNPVSRNGCSPPAPTISIPGASSGISNWRALLRSNTSAPTFRERPTSTPAVTGSPPRSTVQCGFRAMFRQIGSPITTGTGSIAIHGDGFGSRMNRGAMRHSITAGGSTTTAGGAGCRDR